MVISQKYHEFEHSHYFCLYHVPPWARDCCLSNSTKRWWSGFIVNDGTFDGVTNKIEKAAWHPGITLGDLLPLSHSDSASVLFLLAQKKAIIYKGHILRSQFVRDDIVVAGDVLVFGLVDSERAEQLDHIPEVKSRLGTKWSKYEHWIRRATPKPERSPSA